MKKFFAALLVALFGAMSLFADDAADVKAVIVRDFELTIKGDFAGKFAAYAPDYLETDSDGMTINYEQAKWVVLMLDGKHPKEFLLVMATVELKGAAIPPEMMARIDEVVRNPEFVKQYEEAIPVVVAMLKEEAAFELKSLNFISVNVNGNEAVVVDEYDSKDAKSGEIKHKVCTASLRKVDGKWMIYRSIAKNK